MASELTTARQFGVLTGANMQASVKADEMMQQCSNTVMRGIVYLPSPEIACVAS